MKKRGTRIKLYSYILPFLVLSFIFVIASGELVHGEPACTDTDGKNIYVKGIAKSVEGPDAGEVTDYCIDEFNVNEAFCQDDGNVGLVSYRCDNGCKDGICLKEKPLCGNGVCETGEETSCPSDCCPKLETLSKKEGCTYAPRYDGNGCIAGYDEKCSNAPSCKIGGCSGELCGEPSLIDNAATSCIHRPEYACYSEFGRCERQSDAKCTWTPTEELANCLKNKRAVCGNGVCESGEDSASCPGDCKKSCFKIFNLIPLCLGIFSSK